MQQSHSLFALSSRYICIMNLDHPDSRIISPMATLDYHAQLSADRIEVLTDRWNFIDGIDIRHFNTDTNPLSSVIQTARPILAVRDFFACFLAGMRVVGNNASHTGRWSFI